MLIRVMTIDDYYGVHRLWANTAGVGLRSLDDSFDGIARFVARNPTSNFVVEDNGKIIGVILCGHDGRRGHLYHMAVDEKARRLGVGKALVDAATEALKVQGITRVKLDAFYANEAGNAFWEAMGFYQRADLICWHKSLNDDNI